MFEIVFDNAKVFKDSVDAIVSLIDEGEFLINKDGIELRAMAPSQVVMVDFTMPSKAIEKFEVPKETKIGLNLDDLAKITARTRPGETLTLNLDKTSSRLQLTFKGKYTRKFDLPLLDLSQAETRKLELEFDASVKINGNTLKENLKDASLVSSYAKFTIDRDGFHIESTGDKGELRIETRKDQDVLLDHTLNVETQAVFLLDYLNDMVKTADASTIVSLHMKKDAPIKLEYNIGEATVAYFLAPRIENP